MTSPSRKALGSLAVDTLQAIFAMINASNGAGLDDFRLPELDELLGPDVFGVGEGVDEHLDFILLTASKETSQSGATYIGSPSVLPVEARANLAQIPGPDSADSGLEDIYSFLDLPSSASGQSGVFDYIAGMAQGRAHTWIIESLKLNAKYEFDNLQDCQELGNVCEHKAMSPSRQAPS